MKVFKNPARKEWDGLLQRPYSDNEDVINVVKDILKNIKQRGDIALQEYTKQFQDYAGALEVTNEEIEKAGNSLTPELKKAIQVAAENIERFHTSQFTAVHKIETMPGISCWRKSVGIERVGLYIPGGTAPLFSTVLMLGIPAKLAGCKEVILCTPCNENGEVHDAILFCAKLVGINKIFKIGGAQAIAAMAYGTKTFKAAHKIFGPGNQFVTAAKQMVQMDGIAIDMPAGPSEVCILADETANASFVAADLLSQAEHGKDSQVLLISNSEEFVEECLNEINIQVKELSRSDIATSSLENSKAILVKDLTEGIEMANQYAAEHLIIACKNAEEIAEQVTTAGSVFIGNYSPEAVGDYASGTNHTLPTNGFAKAYSGVSVDSFVKKITFQQLTGKGLSSIADTVIAMAEAEGLDAHAKAVSIRLKN
jgi:histidinol dehydrogenase